MREVKRRKMGYWEPFNVWWREYVAQHDKRPKVHEMKKWYETNAERVWGGTGPTWDETKKHSKGMRRIEDISDYFRQYRRGRRKKAAGCSIDSDTTDSDAEELNERASTPDSEKPARSEVKPPRKAPVGGRGRGRPPRQQDGAAAAGAELGSSSFMDQRTVSGSSGLSQHQQAVGSGAQAHEPHAPLPPLNVHMPPHEKENHLQQQPIRQHQRHFLHQQQQLQQQEKQPCLQQLGANSGGGGAPQFPPTPAAQQAQHHRASSSSFPHGMMELRTASTSDLPVRLGSALVPSVPAQHAQQVPQSMIGVAPPPQQQPQLQQPPMQYPQLRDRVPQDLRMKLEELEQQEHPHHLHANYHNHHNHHPQLQPSPPHDEYGDAVSPPEVHPVAPPHYPNTIFGVPVPVPGLPFFGGWRSRSAGLPPGQLPPPPPHPNGHPHGGHPPPYPGHPPPPYMQRSLTMPRAWSHQGPAAPPPAGAPPMHRRMPPWGMAMSRMLSMPRSLHTQQQMPPQMQPPLPQHQQHHQQQMPPQAQPPAQRSAQSPFAIRSGSSFFGGLASFMRPASQSPPPPPSAMSPPTDTYMGPSAAPPPPPQGAPPPPPEPYMTASPPAAMPPPPQSYSPPQPYATASPPSSQSPGSSVSQHDPNTAEPPQPYMNAPPPPQQQQPSDPYMGPPPPLPQLQLPQPVHLNQTHGAVPPQEGAAPMPQSQSPAAGRQAPALQAVLPQGPPPDPFRTRTRVISLPRSYELPDDPELQRQLQMQQLHPQQQQQQAPGAAAVPEGPGYMSALQEAGGVGAAATGGAAPTPDLAPIMENGSAEARALIDGSSSASDAHATSEQRGSGSLIGRLFTRGSTMQRLRELFWSWASPEHEGSGGAGHDATTAVGGSSSADGSADGAGTSGQPGAAAAAPVGGGLLWGRSNSNTRSGSPRLGPAPGSPDNGPNPFRQQLQRLGSMSSSWLLGKRSRDEGSPTTQTSSPSSRKLQRGISGVFRPFLDMVSFGPRRSGTFSAGANVAAAAAAAVAEVDAAQAAEAAAAALPPQAVDDVMMQRPMAEGTGEHSIVASVAVGGGAAAAIGGGSGVPADLPPVMSCDVDGERLLLEALDSQILAALDEAPSVTHQQPQLAVAVADALAPAGASASLQQPFDGQVPPPLPPPQQQQQLHQAVVGPMTAALAPALDMPAAAAAAAPVLPVMPYMPSQPQQQPLQQPPPSSSSNPVRGPVITTGAPAAARAAAAAAAAAAVLGRPQHTQSPPQYNGFGHHPQTEMQQQQLLPRDGSAPLWQPGEHHHQQQQLQPMQICQQQQQQQHLPQQPMQDILMGHEQQQHLLQDPDIGHPGGTGGGGGGRGLLRMSSSLTDYLKHYVWGR